MARAVARGVGLCAAIAVWALPASAEDVADAYKGKTFNLVVGHEAGSGFDVYGRAPARHLGRYIPGNPTVVVQNMNGASGAGRSGPGAAGGLHRHREGPAIPGGCGQDAN